MKSTTQRIEELTTLGADWDGNGAVKPDPAAMAFAASHDWLNDLPPPDSVSPSQCGGGVILVWDKGPGDVELHISYGDYEIQVTYVVNTGSVQESRELVLEGLRRIGVTE